MIKIEFVFTRKIIDRNSDFVNTNIDNYFIKRLTKGSFKGYENYIELEKGHINGKNKPK